MAGMEATWWLNERLEAWLGERNAADTLTQSAPGNVTSEMGLALLDVADAIRPHPDVVAFLHRVEDEDFLDELAERARRAGGARRHPGLPRRRTACAASARSTSRGRAGASAPPRSCPSSSATSSNFEPGAGERRFEQGRQEARRKEQELLERLRALPDGERKADEAKRMIDRVRTFIGYREYPKYGMVSRYFVYKQALLEEAERLVRAGVLREREDVFYLTFQELRDVVRTSQVDDAAHRPAQGRVQVVSRRSPRRACSRRTARSSPARTGATTCRPARWSASRSPAGPSRGGRASSWTWPTPISSRATSWSPPTRTRAGRRCSSRSRAS